MVSFALGLFLGFCLGVLCMALLFVARASEPPMTPSLVTPSEQEDPAHRVIGPSEAPSHPFPKD